MATKTPLNSPTTGKKKSKHTTDRNGVIRFDYLFSYWMFLWFVLYYFLPTTINTNSTITYLFKQYGNPLYVFYLGILENLITLGLLIWYNPSAYLIIKYIIMMCITKVYPAYLLQNKPIHWKANLALFIVVFLIYNMYLIANQTSFYEVYEKTLTSVIEDRDLTPLYAYTKMGWNTVRQLWFRL
jgi:hypothetical protein